MRRIALLPMKVDFIVDEGVSREDSYLIKDNIFGVFDGANSHNRFADSAGKTGGLIASQLVRDVFARNNRPLKELAIEANNKLREAMLAANIDMGNKLNLWLSTASVVRLKEGRFEWLQISDSPILLIYDDGSFRLAYDFYEHDQPILMKMKGFAMQKKENVQEYVRAPLTKLRASVNIVFGDFSGEKGFIDFLHTGEEKLQKIRHMVIFSDGLQIPREEPSKEYDYATFVKIFLEGGLEKVKNHVRDMESNDPKCWKYPRYKIYDDITAIAISF